MDMQIDSTRIRTEREKRAWSQEHLAGVCGLSLRTVQRIERSGAASFETAKALASVFELDVAMLAAPVRGANRRPTWIAIAASLLAGACALFIAQAVRADQVMLDVTLVYNDTPLSKSRLITAMAYDNDEAAVSVTSPKGNLFRIGIRPHRI